MKTFTILVGSAMLGTAATYTVEADAFECGGREAKFYADGHVVAYFSDVMLAREEAAVPAAVR